MALYRIYMSGEVMSEEEKESMSDRQLIRKAQRRAVVPVSWIQYEAGWAAYREKPTVPEVQKAAKVTRLIAATLIEKGYPTADMAAYGDRISQVRKVARQIEDYNLSRAMAENGQILRGFKIKLREALGPKFSNLGFDPKALESLTPNKAHTIIQFMDKLMRLEAYALREGADETRVKIEHVNKDSPSDASGKLALLMGEIEAAVKKEPFRKTDEDVIDAEFVESTLSQPYKESNNE